MPGIGNNTSLRDGAKLNIFNDIKLAYIRASIVEKIIYINIACFLFSVLFKSFAINWFALSSSTENLLVKPWSIISYAFIHLRFIHILGNLIILYYIGNLFLDFFTKKQFLNYYFLGAIIGGLSFVLYSFLSSKFSPSLAGASAAVTAIFVGIAAKIPRYALQLRFIGSVELWVLAAIWVVLSILQLASINSGGAIAHLGGAAFGFIYTKQLENGTDIGKWFENIINFFATLFKTTSTNNLKTVYKSKKNTSKKDVSKSQQRKIDDILDKIGKSGYESLSKEEKEYLFRAGKK